MLCFPSNKIIRAISRSYEQEFKIKFILIHCLGLHTNRGHGDFYKRYFIRNFNDKDFDEMAI